MSSNTSRRRDPIQWIMAGLVLWGLYQALGVTGLFVQESLFDARKSAIVLVSISLFLALWGIMLRTKRHLPAIGESGQWSVPGVLSIGLTFLGFGVWGVAIESWERVSTQLTTILGWLVAFCILLSLVAALVALSDPQRRRGKLLGLLTMAFSALAVAGFFSRMSP